MKAIGDSAARHLDSTVHPQSARNLFVRTYNLGRSIPGARHTRWRHPSRLHCAA